MVVIMTVAWFPSSKASEVGKAYLEVMKKYPRDRSLSTPLLNVGVKATKDGLKVVSIGRVKKGKVEEAMDLGYKRFIEYSKRLEGFEYDVEVLLEDAEAMSLVGLGMPE